MGKSTKEKSNNVSSKWIDPVLQGLAYWIGYKKQFYHGHSINEGAIVSEVLSLLSVNSEPNQKICCEEMYSRIVSGTNRKERADLVVYNHDRIESVIEVKRFESGKNLIEGDLKKLARIKNENIGIRCFLLLVSQKTIPFLFVNENGVAYKSTLRIPDSKFSSKVIRVCKAVNSFREDAYLKANYACLIEVVCSKL